MIFISKKRHFFRRRRRRHNELFIIVVFTRLQSLYRMDTHEIVVMII